MNRRVTLGLASGILSLGRGGCQTHESGVTPGVGVSSSGGSGPRIEESSLNNVGLETLWFNPAHDDGSSVHSAHLKPEGLFVSTRPRDNAPAQLKLIKRDDGHPK